MSPSLKYIALLLFIFIGTQSFAQDCGADVPVFNVDLSDDPNGFFASPWVQRVGNCCGTTAPDNCVAFVLTLHPDAEGIIFDVCDGAISSGSMFYQVGCGPETEVGQSICLDGAGPHYLTFCKPGNNENIYCITSVSEPEVSDDLVLNDGCSGTFSVQGFDESTIEWNSVYPGVEGQYNSLMDCSTCTTVNVEGGANLPEYVDFQVCGYPLGGCDINYQCLTVRVNFNPTLAIDVNPNPPIVCFGQSTAEVTGVPSGGTEPYTITWNNSIVAPSTVLPPGVHTVSLQDNSNCPGVEINFEVLQQTQETTAFAGNDLIICEGASSVELSGSTTGSTNAYWTGGEGSFALPPNNLNNTYFPSANEVSGGSFILQLVAESEGNCPIATDEVTVELGAIDSNISLESTDVSCFGAMDGSAELTLTQSPDNYSINWSNIPGSSSLYQTNLIPGTYDVYLVDNIGCDTTIFFNISEPELITAYAGEDQFICQGTNAVEITGFTTGSNNTYWTGGDGIFSSSPNNLNNIYYPSDDEIEEGEFTLELVAESDGDCPTVTDELIIDLGALSPAISLSSSDIDCFGAMNGSAQLDLIQTPDQYEITWSNNPNVNSVYQNNLPAGDFSVTLVDDIGCDTTLYFSIFEPAPLIISDTEVVHPSCYNFSDGSISVETEGGSPPYQYLWNPSMVPQPIQDPFLNNLSAGYHSVTITDVNGCQISFDQTLLNPNPIILDLDFEDLVCVNTVTDINASTNIDEDELSFVWSNIGISGNTQQVLVTDPMNISVHAVDESGCESNQEMAFIAPITLEDESLEVSGSIALCPGGSATLNASFNGTGDQYFFLWSNGLGNMPGQVNYTPNESGYVSFSVTDICNNSIQDSVLVEVHEVPEIELPGNFAQGCAPLEVNFNIDDLDLEGGSYSWNLGNGYFSNQDDYTFVYEESGAYFIDLLYTTPEGCLVESSNSGLISVFPSPEVSLNISPETASINNPEVTFSAENTDEQLTYIWDFGAGTQFMGMSTEYTYDDVGVYNVSLTVINEYGCAAEDLGYVHITPSHEVQVPNMFTPEQGSIGGFYDPNNYDNNIFFPFAEDVAEFNMKIFNRWGELVFESTDINYGWDGHYRGELSPQDVYVYTMEFTFVDGDVVTKMGDVTLIR